MTSSETTSDDNVRIRDKEVESGLTLMMIEGKGCNEEPAAVFATNVMEMVCSEKISKLLVKASTHAFDDTMQPQVWSLIVNYLRTQSAKEDVRSKGLKIWEKGIMGNAEAAVATLELLGLSKLAKEAIANRDNKLNQQSLKKKVKAYEEAIRIRKEDRERKKEGMGSELKDEDGNELVIEFESNLTNKLKDEEIKSKVDSTTKSLEELRKLVKDENLKVMKSFISECNSRKPTWTKVVTTSSVISKLSSNLMPLMSAFAGILKSLKSMLEKVKFGRYKANMTVASVCFLAKTIRDNSELVINASKMDYQGSKNPKLYQDLIEYLPEALGEVVKSLKDANAVGSLSLLTNSSVRDHHLMSAIGLGFDGDRISGADEVDWSKQTYTPVTGNGRWWLNIFLKTWSISFNVKSIVDTWARLVIGKCNVSQVCALETSNRQNGLCNLALQKLDVSAVQLILRSNCSAIKIRNFFQCLFAVVNFRDPHDLRGFGKVQVSRICYKGKQSSSLMQRGKVKIPSARFIEENAGVLFDQHSPYALELQFVNRNISKYMKEAVDWDKIKEEASKLKEAIQESKLKKTTHFVKLGDEIDELLERVNTSHSSLRSRKNQEGSVTSVKQFMTRQLELLVEICRSICQLSASLPDKVMKVMGEVYAKARAIGRSGGKGESIEFRGLPEIIGKINQVATTYNRAAIQFVKIQARLLAQNGFVLYGIPTWKMVKGMKETVVWRDETEAEKNKRIMLAKEEKNKKYMTELGEWEIMHKKWKTGELARLRSLAEVKWRTDKPQYRADYLKRNWWFDTQPKDLTEEQLNIGPCPAPIPMVEEIKKSVYDKITVEDKEKVKVWKEVQSKSELTDNQVAVFVCHCKKTIERVYSEPEGSLSLIQWQNMDRNDKWPTLLKQTALTNDESSLVNLFYQTLWGLYSMDERVAHLVAGLSEREMKEHADKWIQHNKATPKLPNIDSTIGSCQQVLNSAARLISIGEGEIASEMLSEVRKGGNSQLMIKSSKAVFSDSSLRKRMEEKFTVVEEEKKGDEEDIEDAMDLSEVDEASTGTLEDSLRNMDSYTD
jgi:hypothetical protein